MKMMKYFVLSLCLLGLLGSTVMITSVVADDSDSEALGTTIGIDLGTTYVFVAFFFLVLLCFDDRSPFCPVFFCCFRFSLFVFQPRDL